MCPELPSFSTDIRLQLCYIPLRFPRVAPHLLCRRFGGWTFTIWSRKALEFSCCTQWGNHGKGRVCSCSCTLRPLGVCRGMMHGIMACCLQGWRVGGRSPRSTDVGSGWWPGSVTCTQGAAANPGAGFCLQGPGSHCSRPRCGTRRCWGRRQSGRLCVWLLTGPGHVPGTCFPVFCTL